MKPASKSTIFAFLIAVGLLSFTLRTGAQTNNTASLTAQTIILNKPPRPFVPFALDRNPATGQAIDPDAFMTFSDGTRVRWRVAIAELNDLEKKLNAQGETLRGTGLLLTSGEPPPLVTSYLAVDKAALQKQRAELGAKYMQLTPGTMPFIVSRPINVLVAEHDAKIRNDASRITKLRAALAAFKGEQKNRTDNESFNIVVGNDAVVSAYLQGNLRLASGWTGTTANVYAAAGGALLGKKRELLRVTGEWNAPLDQTKQMTSAINVFVLGDKVYTQNKQSPDGFSYGLPSIPIPGGSKRIKFYESSIPVGPFKVDVEAGVNFQAKLTGFVGLRRSYVTVQYGPSLGASVYADASLDAWVAKAGVNANLNLLTETLRYGISQGVEIDPRSQLPVAIRRYEATSELSALNGSVEIYVKQKILPWKQKVWSHDLFKWDGVRYNQVLWNKEYKNFLHDLK